MTLPMTEFKKRRQSIFDKMIDNSIAFIVSAQHHYRNFDNDGVFRQASDFQYVTGFPEPSAVAVLIKQNGASRYVLFNQKRNPLTETWTGPIVGQEQACSHYGADESYDSEDLKNQLPKLIENKDTIYLELSCHPEFEKQLLETLQNIQARVRYRIEAPRKIVNIHSILHTLRLVKSPAELDVMAKVGKISADAHVRCMQKSKPGMYEYQFEAEFIHATMYEGCRHLAYPGIFASGPNACTLHHTSNDRQTKDGELILIDAGAELECYASDITRTFPVNGKFSDRQRALYELVLDTQIKAIDMVKPNANREAIEETVAKNFSQGLIDLGLLKESFSTVLEKGLYRQFYMHRIGHWLGIDTHDRGDYLVDGKSTPYQPGFVLTIEPGLYIPPHIQGIDEKWLGMGIRIEDNVAVTETGHNVLTSAAPKKIDEIEAVMAANK